MRTSLFKDISSIDDDVMADSHPPVPQSDAGQDGPYGDSLVAIRDHKKVDVSHIVGVIR